jgi:hypothetical protein
MFARGGGSQPAPGGGAVAPRESARGTPPGPGSGGGASPPSGERSGLQTSTSETPHVAGGGGARACSPKPPGAAAPITARSSRRTRTCTRHGAGFGSGSSVTHRLAPSQKTVHRLSTTRTPSGRVSATLTDASSISTCTRPPRARRAESPAEEANGASLSSSAWRAPASRARCASHPTSATGLGGLGGGASRLGSRLGSRRFAKSAAPETTSRSHRAAPTEAPKGTRSFRSVSVSVSVPRAGAVPSARAATRRVFFAADASANARDASRSTAETAGRRGTRASSPPRLIGAKNSW